ncbi:cox cluster protein [Haloplanus sp. GCM10025708]|uniref:DUF7520 family protein n=1 Tax=Haloferacaceae TaxID=1644056 RepID=UPI003612681B
MSRTQLDGRRLVLVLYAVVVFLSAVGGVFVGTFVPDLRAPSLFFLVSLPPTPTGLAVFGAVTVGVGLGVPLLLVVLVSRGDDRAA